jgi:RNA polymerase sigma factor (sigma-70 family)
MAQRWEKMIDEAIPVAASEVEKRIVLEEDLRNTHAAIDLLPEKERMALQMKVTMDMNYKDIAQAVGISETSVHKYITRAREKIRKSVYPEE